MPRSILTIVIAACLTATPAALAGGLNPKWVPGDTGWLAHIDIEAVNASTVGSTFLAGVEGSAFDASLDDVEKELGLNPRSDMYGATIFGDGDDDDDVTVLLVTSAKVDQVLTHARAEQSYHAIQVDGRTIDSWSGEDPTYAYVTAAPQADRRVVLLSSKQARVIDAINVMEGRRPHLAQEAPAGGAAARVLPRDGALVFVCAKGLPWLEDDDDHPASMIAQRSDRALLEIREAQTTTHVELVVAAKSNGDATNIADVLRGLLGLGRLLASDVPELAQVSGLLHAAAVSSEGNDIRTTIQASSRDAGQCLAALVRHMSE